MHTAKQMTLRQLKTQATQREYRRVYDNYNLPPRDIRVEHDGRTYVRYAWQSLHHFGWSAWTEVN